MDLDSLNADDVDGDEGPAEHLLVVIENITENVD